MPQGTKLSDDQKHAHLVVPQTGHDEIANLLRRQLQEAASGGARRQHLDDNVAWRLAGYLRWKAAGDLDTE
jgi:hypothetical protein